MKKVISGNEIDKMPAAVFRLMKLFFKIYYFFKPVDNYINTFGIKPGFVVIDYGCGPGEYIKKASELVGDKGLIYAVDIHELAIASVEKRIKKYALNNVKPILTDGKTVEIDTSAADLIFAIDMFHMVKDTIGFLKELNRIGKPGSILIIEDGHQPRGISKEKIKKSDCWEIIQEQKRYLKCKNKK